jgi:dsDNA-binding SOS-regulon protein
MIINYNPEEYESFSEVSICDHHKKHPEDRSYPGCTCSAIFGQRMKKKEPVEPEPVIEVGDTVCFSDPQIHKQGPCKNGATCTLERMGDKERFLLMREDCFCVEHRFDMLSLIRKGPRKHVLEGVSISYEGRKMEIQADEWISGLDKKTYRMELTEAPECHKYSAQRTERDGFKFDSKKEATYYDKLVKFQEAGELLFFLRQVPFHLEGNVRVVVDFMEFWADGTVRIVDVKGYRTPSYKRNKKQVEARYPVIIEEE